MDLTIPAAIVIIGAGTYAALIAAIRQYEKPKPPPVLTLAWVHAGLTEPAPLDPQVTAAPPWWHGAPTGAWPMIWELRDPPELTARQRFEVIEGEVVEPVPATVPAEWARRTFADWRETRLLVQIGATA